MERSFIVRLFQVAALVGAFGAVCYFTTPSQGKPWAAPVQAQRVQRVVGYAQIPYQPQTYNFIGAPIRMEAMQAEQQAQIDQQQLIAEFEAFKAWKASQQQPQQTPAENVAAPQAEPAQQAADPNAPWAAATPNLVKRCGSCHTGDDAKGLKLEDGNVYRIPLDGSADLRAPENWRYRDLAMGAMLSGKMPKGGTLSPEEFGLICEELFGARDPNLTAR